MLIALQALGFGILDFVTNSPALSQTAALSFTLGYVTFSLLVRDLNLWKGMTTTEKLMSAFGFGLTINFLMLFPMYAIFITWSGDAVSINEFSNKNFEIFLGAMLFILLGRRFSKHGHGFRIVFKSFYLILLMLSLSVLAFVTMVWIANSMNVYPEYFRQYAWLGSFTAFVNMILATLLAVIGYYILSIFFFSIIERNETIPLDADRSLRSVRMRRRPLVIAVILMSIGGFISVYIDVNGNLFSPRVVEGNERFYSFEPERPNPIVADIIYEDHINAVEIKTYQDAHKTYTIFPPKLAVPISGDVVQLQNPSNSSFALSDSFNQGCNCIQIKLPDGVTYSRPNEAEVTQIPLNLSQYNSDKPILANLTYTQEFIQRDVNIVPSKTLQDYTNKTKETYTFLVSNNEDAMLTIRRANIPHFNYVYIDKASLELFVDGTARSTGGIHEVNVWTDIMPHSTANVTISFSYPIEYNPLRSITG